LSGDTQWAIIVRGELMNLNDHFHPPLSIRRPWHGVHHAWCTTLSADLNARLPAGFVAMPNVQFNIEIDVATFEEDRAGRRFGAQAEAGEAGAAATAVWSPPRPEQSLRFPLITDVVEALVYNQAGGLSLAGAIELVSPANKDRAAHREAFVSKCETYLQQGVGLLIVDIVTDRSANLHDQLLKRLEDPATVALDSALYAAAYHPVERDEEDRLDVWQQVLEVGKRLPEMPLWLKGGVCLPVELDATYERACRDLRID
jgi:hypothetical protein